MSEYVILRYQRLFVSVEPPDQQDAAAPEPDAREVMDWLPVRRSNGKLRLTEADNPQLAVEDYGREEGVNGGRFKAIAMTAWRGVIPLEEVTELRSTRVEDEDL